MTRGEEIGEEILERIDEAITPEAVKLGEAIEPLAVVAEAVKLGEAIEALAVVEIGVAARLRAMADDLKRLDEKETT